MISNFMLSLRESLEAVLIVGIVLTTLTQENKEKLKKYVWAGMLGGVFISALGGAVLFNTAQSLSDENLEIVEAFMRMIAAGFIAYFVVWLALQNQGISASIKNRVTQTSTGISLFLLVFFGVLREGLELVIYTLTNLTTQSNDVVFATVMGALIAIILGWLIFKSTLKLNLKWVFKGLGLVLIYIGANLFTEGLVHLIPSFEPIEWAILLSYSALALVIFFYQDIKNRWAHL
jgi:high-affinity iron transporter